LKKTGSFGVGANLFSMFGGMKVDLAFFSKMNGTESKNKNGDLFEKMASSMGAFTFKSTS